MLQEELSTQSRLLLTGSQEEAKRNILQCQILVYDSGDKTNLFEHLLVQTTVLKTQIHICAHSLQRRDGGESSMKPLKILGLIAKIERKGAKQSNSSNIVFD